jgi:hypothetical protein
VVSLDLGLVVAVDPLPDVERPVEDVLSGKVWAAQDPERRTSKRRKDMLDIERLIEGYPKLRARVPTELLARIFPPVVT